MEVNLNKAVDKLKRHGATLENGISIVQIGETRHINVHMHKASLKGKKWSAMNHFERQQFEDLLYLSNVGKGNPNIVYV